MFGDIILEEDEIDFVWPSAAEIKKINSLEDLKLKEIKYRADKFGAI